MDKRKFLQTGAAFLAWSATMGMRAAHAAVDAKTKLVVADQSEFIRHLLDASGQRKQIGFQLDLPNFAGGPAIFEAIRAGALDIAYVGDTPPIQARAAGVNLPIIATFTREVAQYRLVQHASAGVERLADLRGKRVSYVEGSGRQVFLIEALHRAGLTLKDVQLVHLRVSELNDALRAKAVDVATLIEPHVTRLAKQTGVTVILVGHVTKEGALAGPRVLEHIVDTVLYFEGDTHSSFRLIRAVKNRYGAVNEIGVFAMTDKGLKGVNNPSAMFLSQHGQEVPGSCVLVTQEGTRPLLVEIQALVDQAHGNPRRLTVGLDAQRLAMLLAVLHRHAGILCVDQDVFVNAVGGVKITEPAADLSVLISIVSSLKNKALPSKLIVFGEVGLAGEIRPAPRGQERLKEAAKLGFTRAIIPEANKPRQAIAGMEIIAVRRVEEAFNGLRELE